jgi:hypothetical protein
MGSTLIRCACVSIAAIAAAALLGFPSGSELAAELPVPPQGNTYFVSPAGRDDNAGTEATPWATPGYGSRQLKPGDTLMILPGTYVLARYDEDILKPPSGKPDAWVTIKGGPGGRPVLAGRSNLLTAMDLSGVSHVRIENLEITHDPKAKGQNVYFRDGIELLERPGEHIVLKDLHIHHLDEFGLNVQDVNHLEIIDCRIEYCGFGAMGGPAKQKNGWQNVRINGCRLSYGGHYYQGTDGKNRPYDRPDGFGIEVSDGPVEIAHTVAEHNRGDGLDSKAANTYIHHCTVANNSCDGIKLWGGGSKVENCLIYGTGDGEGGDSPWAGIVIDHVEKPGARFELENDTHHDTPTRRPYSMYVQYDGKAAIQVLMRNCIVANAYGAAYFGPPVKLTADHCLFFRPGEDEQVVIGEKGYSAADIAGGKLGPGNLCRDPKFVAPAWGKQGDYHLQSDSPCIGAGSAEGTPGTDLDGKQRPADKPPDIGCYQKQAAPVPGAASR